MDDRSIGTKPEVTFAQATPLWAASLPVRERPAYIGRVIGWAPSCDREGAATGEYYPVMAVAGHTVRVHSGETFDYFDNRDQAWTVAEARNRLIDWKPRGDKGDE